MQIGQPAMVHERRLASAGAAAGLACVYRADTPETTGQAMEVPVAVMLAVVE